MTIKKIDMNYIDVEAMSRSTGASQQKILQWERDGKFGRWHCKGQFTNEDVRKACGWVDLARNGARR